MSLKSQIVVTIEFPSVIISLLINVVFSPKQFVEAVKFISGIDHTLIESEKLSIHPLPSVTVSDG